jgi:hypothetical protein
MAEVAEVVDALRTLLSPSRTDHSRQGGPYPMGLVAGEEPETERPARKASMAAWAAADADGPQSESRYR